MTDAQGANAELSAKRAQWQEWARQQFSGDEGQVQAVADAALRAALAGASSQEAVAAARDAAARAGATPVAAPPVGPGHGLEQPPATAPPPVPSGYDATITRPSLRAPWYRRPLVLLTMAAIIVVLVGLLIWGITSHSSGPSTPQTSVVPTTSTTNPTTTTKRTRKPKTTSPTSPTAGAASTGSVTITIP